ncbi:MAG TPA: hypothetical protein GX698_02400, partial [Acholeplasmataceae bacterium]|nr:hypothetical protein [Acholeplasmataceae bacterium]
MKRNLISKVFISLFIFIFILVLSPLVRFDLSSRVNDNDLDKVPLFSNQNFITDLVAPNKQPVDNLVSFSGIYSIIES